MILNSMPVSTKRPNVRITSCSVATMAPTANGHPKPRSRYRQGCRRPATRARQASHARVSSPEIDRSHDFDPAEIVVAFQFAAQQRYRRLFGIFSAALRLDAGSKRSNGSVKATCRESHRGSDPRRASGCRRRSAFPCFAFSSTVEPPVKSMPRFMPTVAKPIIAAMQTAADAVKV
jgi:hypothetical protein